MGVSFDLLQISKTKTQIKMNKNLQTYLKGPRNNKNDKNN